MTTIIICIIGLASYAVLFTDSLYVICLRIWPVLMCYITVQFGIGTKKKSCLERKLGTTSKNFGEKRRNEEFLCKTQSNIVSMCNYNTDYSNNEVVWSWINTTFLYYSCFYYTTTQTDSNTNNDTPYITQSRNRRTNYHRKYILLIFKFFYILNNKALVNIF